MIGDWLDPCRMSRDSLKIYQQEGLVVEITELIAQAMREKGISKSDLAERLGKSRSFVTQLLGGSANMTLKTVADVFTAMNLDLTVQYRTPSWMKPAAAATPKTDKRASRPSTPLITAKRRTAAKKPAPKGKPPKRI